MDSVEPPGMLLEELQRVVPVEPERVVGLRLDVDPDNVETGPVVAHRRSAGSAEQVQQQRPRARAVVVHPGEAAPTVDAEPVHARDIAPHGLIPSRVDAFGGPVGENAPISGPRCGWRPDSAPRPREDSARAGRI